MEKFLCPKFVLKASVVLPLHALSSSHQCSRYLLLLHAIVIEVDFSALHHSRYTLDLSYLMCI